MDKLDNSENKIDKLVSERLKLRRTMLGITQQELGDAVNLSVKQIQKYEDATSTISGSQLYIFTKLLKVPINYFVEITHNTKVPNQCFVNSPKDHNNSISDNIIAEDGVKYLVSLQYDTLVDVAEKEISSLIKAFAQVQSPQIRCKIVELVKSMISSS